MEIQKKQHQTQEHQTPLLNTHLIKNGIALALLILVADQVTKWLIRDVVLTDGQTITIFPFFNLVEVWNYGISFGLFQAGSFNGALVLVFIAAVITILFVVILKNSETLWVSLSCGMIIGGAIGNMIDRLIFGAVYDFLDFHAFGFHWPAFNIADSAIVIGIGMIAIDHIFWAPTREKNKGTQT